MKFSIGNNYCIPGHKYTIAQGKPIISLECLPVFTCIKLYICVLAQKKVNKVTPLRMTLTTNKTINLHKLTTSILTHQTGRGYFFPFFFHFLVFVVLSKYCSYLQSLSI